ncbi:hypothetical protein, conserved [Leishmania tarentolae]|uniref:Uncharacterized protein n=1 Tax=Leishmania tarentolae TaxID=5689 RepID=A0A640KNV6_LEITA|nr:hypothetical protein, conserved [Leishmania tarentolae]
MTSEASIAIGVGVTLAFFALLVLFFIFVGVYANDSRTRDFDREREQRVEQVRQRHREEQAQWRERRLRDVILLLIERGEALEGVSLAFQLPHRPEVGARRMLSSRYNANLVRQNLEIQIADEQANSRLDEEAQMIAHRPLSALLRNGRPPDAEPGPDVMQILLDGQEIQHYTTSDDDSDFYMHEEDAPPANVTVFTSSQTNEETQLDRGSDRTASPTPLVSSALAPHQQQQQGDSDGAMSSNVSAEETNMSARTAAVLLQEQQLLETREMALLQELRREKRRKYRKTAEEVYGEGADYQRNPAQDTLGRTQVVCSGDSPQSPLWRFLSPITSFRGIRSLPANKSAFEGLSSPESTFYREENTVSRSPISGRKNRSREVAPF